MNLIARARWSDGPWHALEEGWESTVCGLWLPTVYDLEDLLRLHNVTFEQGTFTTQDITCPECQPQRKGGA